LKLLALAVLLAVPVALLIGRFFGGFVREALAVPFLYLSWIARVYARTVPRSLLWGALLLFGVALAVTNVVVVLGRDKGYRSEAALELESGYADTVEQLRSQIRFAGRSLYFRRSLAKRLGRLVLRSRDHGDQYRPAEMHHVLHDLDAPPAVHQFFRESENLTEPTRGAGWRIWVGRLLGIHRGEYAPPDDLGDVIAFLEDRLEVL
jgi:hypothetical protein